MKTYSTILVLCLWTCFASVPALAVEFTPKGLWQFSFSGGQKNLVNKIGDKQVNAADKFDARQRLRLQLDAVASESLSGTVYFEIGNQLWGRSNQGAALGTDGTVVKVRQAYLDWVIPRTDIKVRMGLQNISLPKRANLLGGLVIDNADMAGITTNIPLTDSIGLTAFWLRPFNDNYSGSTLTNDANYLDNMDVFGITLPVRLEGVELNPWALYGMRGKNMLPSAKPAKIWTEGWPTSTLGSNPFGYQIVGNDAQPYGTMFWFGVPVGITSMAPWNVEFDFNYGYVEEMGHYAATVRRGQGTDRASTRREGWIASALMEYRLDWGTPGIFTWYGSGDDDSLKNGSERMPSIAPWSKFSSTLGGNTPFPNGYVDMSCNLAGTWGAAFRLRDMSYLEDLRHTFRAIYIRGTNSSSMVKYASKRNDMEAQYVDNSAPRGYSGYYLTEKDALLEFNFDSMYKVYDNLTVGLELGYVVNMLDHDVWQSSKRDYLGPSASMQDIWKATLYVGYSF